MQIVKQTKNGIAYLIATLREKKTVVTRVMFWRIPHSSGKEELSLKIGRYKRDMSGRETVETEIPKSELTLDDEELQNLLSFISENYEPFRAGARRYIAIDEKFDTKNIEHIRAIFRNPDKDRLLSFIIDNDVVPEDLIHDIQHNKKVRAISEFEEMLERDLVEADWQRWFKANDWVLGSDYVRVLDERTIDPENIADYLVEAYDGFLDIIEIKRPGGSLRFWSSTLDHGNHVPSMDVVKAISQSTSYLFEVEREINSDKFLERIGGVRVVKPRCVLVFGRSNEWNDEQRRAYRILNASYHNLSIMTYDHVLARAKRLLGLDRVDDEVVANDTPNLAEDEDIPF